MKLLLNEELKDIHLTLMCAKHVHYSESEASCVNIQLALKLPQAQCSEPQQVS